MIRIEVRAPIAVVVIAGSDETTAPCRDHDIFRGSSPRMIEQVIWAKLPSSTVSDEKLKGPICGGSDKEYRKSMFEKEIISAMVLTI